MKHWVISILTSLAGLIGIAAYSVAYFMENEKMLDKTFNGLLAFEFVLLYFIIRILAPAKSIFFIELFFGLAINALYDELFGNPFIFTQNEYIAVSLIVITCLILKKWRYERSINEAGI